MATLLKSTVCASCGQLHHFVLRHGVLSTAREYEFRCPQTKEKARLTPTTAGEEVRFPPPGAVFLSAVAS
jgi:hypothetical protein